MEIESPELYRGNVVMTRVRLARNLRDYPFQNNAVDAKEIVKKVNRALLKCDTFNLLFMSNFDMLSLESLKEQHLISQALIDNKISGAALINGDKSISVMVNEEDVIREQCFMRGLRLTEAYKKIERIDNELSKNLNFAFDKRLGYLTACPTNLGTGLRASVLLFLPALTEGTPPICPGASWALRSCWSAPASTAPRRRARLTSMPALRRLLSLLPPVLT